MVKTSEIWKDVPGYEGYYQVSNLGRVKSFDQIIHQGPYDDDLPIYGLNEAETQLLDLIHEREKQAQIEALQQVREKIEHSRAILYQGPDAEGFVKGLIGAIYLIDQQSKEKMTDQSQQNQRQSKYCSKCRSNTKHFGNICRSCFKKIIKSGKSPGVIGNRTGGKWG